MSISTPLPHHIAIIPDGNRRWASRRALSPWQGHEHGTARFREISRHLFNAGVTHVTFWAASYDNLQKRSRLEVEYLYKILRTELSKPALLDEFIQNEVNVKVIGAWRELVQDKKLIQAIENLEQQTAAHDRHYLTILFAYDGKMEMLAAVNELRTAERATEHDLRSHLWTGNLPDVDLVIRTGGEPHWSAGFMMWLTANSQFYFTELLWPDFDTQAAADALTEYARRGRRLGK